jgi:hypothetical protein
MGVHRSLPSRARMVLGWGLLSIAVFAGCGQGAAASESGSATTGTHIGRVLKRRRSGRGNPMCRGVDQRPRIPSGAIRRARAACRSTSSRGSRTTNPSTTGTSPTPRPSPPRTPCTSTRRAVNDPSTTPAPTCRWSPCREVTASPAGYLGDGLSKVPAWTVPQYQSGPDVRGASERHVRALLLDTRHGGARMPRHTAGLRLCADGERMDERGVHLACHRG